MKKNSVQIIVKSADFKKVKERPNSPKTLEYKLSDSDESSDVFFVNFSDRRGGISFSSVEIARKYLLGTLQVEAFAKSDANEESRVFSAPESTLLDCSDLRSENSLDLSWLFGDELPKLGGQEDDESDVLFLEFVKDARKLTVELKPSAIQDIRSNARKRNPRDKSDSKSFVILRCQEIQ